MNLFVNLGMSDLSYLFPLSARTVTDNEEKHAVFILYLLNEQFEFLNIFYSFQCRFGFHPFVVYCRRRVDIV